MAVIFRGKYITVVTSPYNKVHCASF